MHSLGQDLRFAFRLLAKSPGFASAAVLVLALGIGANSAIFSVVDAALLRPLPFHRPGELTTVWEAPRGFNHNAVSPLNYQDWHDQNRAFASMAAICGGPRTLVGSGEPEQIPGVSVTRDFFAVFGIRPAAGRFFTAEDERSEAPVAVISERLWKRRFGGDPKLIGGKLNLDGVLSTVAGIAPSGFEFLWPSDLWTLQTIKRSPEQRKMHYERVVARLKTGVTVAQAQSDMDVIAARIAQLSPETNKDWGAYVEPLRQTLVGKELRTTSWVLAGVVGFVLLMACANVANLMLARGTARAREMAVRASLGAGRGRLARQLLTESLLLALLGGSAGLALAAAVIRSAPTLIPARTLPVGVTVALDGRVTAFAAVVTLATALLFGLAPAWQVARGALADALRGARAATAGSSRTLATLAAVEIAIAVMLMAGAGLFLRTMERLGEVDPGFHADRVLTLHLGLPNSRYPDPAHALLFYQAVQREIEVLPGVRTVAFGDALPLTGWDIGQGFRVTGRERLSGAANYQIVSPAYFEALGIPLLSGRPFTTLDAGSAPEVAIVNQEFVRRYLKDTPPIGVHIQVYAMDPIGPKWVDREIVGVAGQVKVDNLGETENSIEIYVPITQNPWFWSTLCVRTAIDPLAMTTAIKAAIAKVDPDLAVRNVQTMDQISYDSVARPRFRARLLGGFAALALLLAAVGVFGVLAFAVTQRTREFGIRLALGARAGDVLGIVLSRGMRIAGAGIGAGLLGSAALARSLGSLLFGVKPLDPVAFLAAPLVLGLVALGAAAAPALRASRVDPAIALREE